MGYLKKSILKGRKVVQRGETLFEAGFGGNVGIPLALIRQSQPHYHEKITEWYFVIDGSINVILMERWKS